ncbi:MAG: glycosyltransferase family 2 protein [Phycisphaera sp.]|nr:MAG: glycosyltransferase family 2 protein [Phycisphaera sp.]
MTPTVSVIIPTRGRPKQVCEAVESVLNQQLPDRESVEVIVVQDGPDSETTEALSAIQSERLRIVSLPCRRGHATSRNVGIREAQGKWCAFLDDDDSWMPEKLAKQLEIARQLVDDGALYPVVGCVVLAVTEQLEMQWPSRGPWPGEEIGSYLYARRGWRSVLSGHTLLQTSMVMLPTALARNVSFRGGMRRHADPDWFLRLQGVEGVRFVIPMEAGPLARWNLGGIHRVSASGDWRYSLVWARRHARELGPRAVAGFLSGPAAHIASGMPGRSSRRRAFKVLLREMFDLGEPGFWDLLALVVKYTRMQNRRPRSRLGRSGSVGS